MISGSWDSRAWPSHDFDFVWSLTRSPGVKIIFDNFAVVGCRLSVVG